LNNSPFILLLGAKGLFLTEFSYFIDVELEVINESRRILCPQRFWHTFDFFIWNRQKSGTYIIQSSVKICLITCLLSKLKAAGLMAPDAAE